MEYKNEMWTKGKMEQLAVELNLSTSQVYKWCWDMVRKNKQIDSLSRVVVLV